MTEPAVRRAALGIVHAMVFADGRVADAEHAWLIDLAREHPLFAEASDAELRAMLGAALEEASSGALPHAVEKWARQIPPEWAAPVFTLAVSAAFADGRMVESEGYIAIHLRELLSIPVSQAASIYREVRGD
jgi:uncharacterized tellurite resistance protein B-like protein